MAQNEQKPSRLQPELCQQCLQMFGHPSFDNLCSKCFKKQKQSKVQQIEHSTIKPQKLIQKQSETPQIQQPLPSKKRQLQKQQAPQPVKGRCNKCSKKTGMLDYKCKHCHLQFCKFHRLPQEHDCLVDFITLGRKQIKSDNPVVASKKIQKI